MIKTIFFFLISFSVFAECLAPQGPSMSTGDSRTFFTTAYKPENKTCEFSHRTCLANGSLSGNPKAVFETCLDEKTCEHPFSPDRLTDQEQVQAYKNPEPPCIEETRICDGKTGVLSGSFLHNLCL